MKLMTKKVDSVYVNNVLTIEDTEEWCTQTDKIEELFALYLIWAL